MKAIFFATAALALVAANPASAQLLGGNGGGALGGSLGSLGGTLGGQGGGSLGSTIGRAGDPVATTTRTASDARGSTRAERRVDRRNGRVQASGETDGSITGAVGNTTQALGASRTTGGNAQASGGLAGGVDATLVGTDDIRNTTGQLRDQAGNTAGQLRDGAGNAVSRTRDLAGSAASGQSIGGQANGLIAGSAGQDGLSGSASGSGSGALSLGNAALPALDPGARVEDARGRLIGSVQNVRRDAAGQVEAVDVAVGRRIATLPAANFTAQGDVLVSAMDKGDVKDAAED